MAKKKKEYDNYDYEEEDTSDVEGEPYEYQEDENTYQDNNVSMPEPMDEETVANALQFAAIVSKPSDQAAYYKHMPVEVRRAFLDSFEKREILKTHRNYNRYQHIRKVLKLQKIEDEAIKKKRRMIYEVKTEDQFKEYLRANHCLSMFDTFQNMGAIPEILQHISEMKQTGFQQDLDNMEEELVNIFDVYKSGYNVPEHIDNMGLSSNIFASSVVSMGYQGNERYAINTSITATKNIDTQREIEKEATYKSAMRRFFDKIR